MYSFLLRLWVKVGTFSSLHFLRRRKLFDVIQPDFRQCYLSFNCKILLSCCYLVISEGTDFSDAKIRGRVRTANPICIAGILCDFVTNLARFRACYGLLPIAVFFDGHQSVNGDTFIKTKVRNVTFVRSTDRFLLVNGS